MLPVGLGCCLPDAIRDVDKAEKETDIRREERDQRADVARQREDANSPEEVFLVPGKHTHAAALNVVLEACFGMRSNPVDGEARGRISLRCSRKVADALCKGILVGGRSVRAESEEPSDDDEMHRRPKGGANDARRSTERGREGKAARREYAHRGQQLCVGRN